jgi:hypothetical protein
MSEAVALLTEIRDLLKVIASGAKPTAVAKSIPVVASESDLLGPYGDEVVKFMPRDWAGEDFARCRMSECPAELLDMLAETYDYFAQKNESANAVTASGKPKADYDRRSAARARGWAARVRAGKVTRPEPEPVRAYDFDAEPMEPISADDIGF